MNIGIIGLGLIGGSLAKAIKANSGCTVLGGDLSEAVLGAAMAEGAVDMPLDEGDVEGCDIIILALYPEAAVNWLKRYARLIAKDAIVTDTCGVKRCVCAEAFTIAAENGFAFIGGHPMAGTERTGYGGAKADMFKGASMLLTPPQDCEAGKLKRLSEFFLALGFGSIKVTTPENHDRMIAYTSQLAHVLSSAYVKTPAALDHVGYSAGSFKDMTRVARLNDVMWTELFLENADYLASEAESLAGRLMEYAAAIRQKDAGTLSALLREGVRYKELSETGSDEINHG